MLTNPFHQEKQLFADTSANAQTPAGTNQDGEAILNVYMVKSHVEISMCDHEYGEVEPSKAKTASDTSKPLHI